MYILDGDKIIEGLSHSEAIEKFGEDKYDIYSRKKKVSDTKYDIELDGKVYSLKWKDDWYYGNMNELKQ